ncbi:hypothetical protein BDF14DRAFT_552114 [Spinellus fusiger]|nr:hypothetical protein BDF14DRAFT_552114 [Spinellus fusiger]
MLFFLASLSEFHNITVVITLKLSFFLLIKANKSLFISELFFLSIKAPQMLCAFIFLFSFCLSIPMLNVDGREWPTVNLDSYVYDCDSTMTKPEKNDTTPPLLSKRKRKDSYSKVYTEKKVIDLLTRNEGEERAEFFLDDFIFYRAKRGALCSLTAIYSSIKFDGIITRLQENAAHVGSVRVMDFTLTDMELNNKQPKIWVKSATNKHQVYYLLRSPAEKYISLWKEFEQGVQLLKIVLHYLEAYPNAILADTKPAGSLNLFIAKHFADTCKTDDNGMHCNFDVKMILL